MTDKPTKPPRTSDVWTVQPEGAAPADATTPGPWIGFTRPDLLGMPNWQPERPHGKIELANPLFALWFAWETIRSDAGPLALYPIARDTVLADTPGAPDEHAQRLAHELRGELVKAWEGLGFNAWPEAFKVEHLIAARGLHGGRGAIEVADALTEVADALTEVADALTEVADAFLSMMADVVLTVSGMEIWEFMLQDLTMGVCATHPRRRKWDIALSIKAAWPDVDMLPLDERAAAWMTRYGAVGNDTANNIRTKAGERWRAFHDAIKGDFGDRWILRRCGPENEADLWKLWRQGPDGLRFAAALARVLWHDVVKPQLEREARYPVPMMARATVRQYSEIVLEPGWKIEGLANGAYRVKGAGGLAALLPANKVQNAARRHGLSSVDGEALREILTRQVGALSKCTGHRAFHWLVSQGHRKMMYEGERTIPAEIVYPGGLAELARAIGCKSKQDPDIVRDVLDALEALRLPLYGDSDIGHVHLLTWDYKPARGQKPGRIRIMLYEPMLGMFVRPEVSPRLRDRLLAPIPQPLIPAALVLPQQSWGAQGTLLLEIMLYLTDHSRELAEHGGVELANATWTELADRAGVPTRILPDVRSKYEAPAGGLWPVLKRSPSGLYAPADPGILQVLQEQGKVRTEARKEARKGRPRHE